jgi:hypothetical protein
MARPRAELIEEQVRTVAAVMDALPAAARPFFALGIERQVQELQPCASGAFVVTSIAAHGTSAECRPCLLRALNAWRAEFPALLVRALQGYARAVAGQEDGVLPDGRDTARSALEDGWRTAQEALELRVVAGCTGCVFEPASPDPAVAARAEAAAPPRRLPRPSAADVPEFAAMVAACEPFRWTFSDGTETSSADAPAADAAAGDPFGLHDQFPSNPVGDPVRAEWLCAVLRRCGVAPERLQAVEALVQDHEAEWARSVQPRCDEVGGISEFMDDQAGRPIGTQAAFDAALRAARAADDALVAAVTDATGLPADDAALLRLARRLGDARHESPIPGGMVDAVDEGALRANPAEVLLSTDIGPAARPAAVSAILAHGPELESRLAAVRAAAIESAKAFEDSSAGLPDEGAPSEDQRLAMIDVLERGAERVAVANAAHAAAVAQAIEAACAVLPAPDAAALRATLLRRRHPEAFMDEQLVRMTVAELLEALPADDAAAHVELAAMLDAWVALAWADRAHFVALADQPPPAGMAHRDATAARAARIGPSMDSRRALAVLAVERLALAAPPERLRASRRFRELVSRTIPAEADFLARCALSSAP